MPKINKDSLKILPKTNIQIYKFEQGKNYYCHFYIGSHKGYSSKRLQKCLKTQNINDAISKATEIYKEWFKTHTDTKRKEKDFDLDIAQPYLHFKVKK